MLSVWLVDPLLLVLVVILPSVYSTPCPPGCTCHDSRNNFTELKLRCLSYSGPAFPTNIPERTRDIFLQGNGTCVQALTQTDLLALTALERLQIKDCSLRVIHRGTFDNQKDMKYLELSRNDLQELPNFVFEGLSKINRIFLDNNNIRLIGEQAFRGVGELSERTVLSVENNAPLTTIHPLAFDEANIQELYLSNCNLSSSALAALSPLKPCLETLFLQRNAHPLILNDTLNGFSLTTLVLESNELRDVSFLDHVTIRQTLSLAGNPIGDVDFSKFRGLHHVRTLNLDYTGRTHLQMSSFDRLRRLNQVHLAGNFIATLAPTIQLLLQQLTGGLTFNGNPFHCNCELAWFQRWLWSHPHSYISGTLCFTPSRGDMITYGEMRCFPPSQTKVTLVKVNSDVVLQCDSQADPSPSFVWSYALNSSASWSIPHSEQRIKLTRTELFQSGKYQSANVSCNAFNALGSDSGHILVSVPDIATASESLTANCSKFETGQLLGCFAVLVLTRLIVSLYL